MTGTASSPSIALARRYSRFYFDMGWQPLPSARNRQIPAIRGGWGRYQHERIEERIIDEFWSESIQMICGAAWGLAVVDSDEPEGVAAFRAMCEGRPSLGAWVVRSPGQGRHYWFSVPESLDRVPTCCLWSGAGSAKVEFLGDGRLIKAPPSPHWKTGKPYEFMGPDPITHRKRPAELPGWLLEMVAEKSSRPAPVLAAKNRQLAIPVELQPGVSFDRDEVLSAIHDKPALAASWGLKFFSKEPNASGWMKCHSVYREDRNPSASFSPLTGVYMEQNGPRLSLLDLAVELGAYRDWREAVADLAATYGVKPKGD